MDMTVYQRIGDPMAAIEKLGEIIAYSGLFGCSKKEQGQVLAMQCLVEGKPPLELAKTYHLIEGKLSMKADTMLARFQMSGGKVQWIERTNERVKAKFAHNGNEVLIEHTLEEHRSSGTAMGNNGKLKDNWRKFPRQMLTARVVSEGVRLLAPEINFGIYTPEEVGDFDAKPAVEVKEKPELSAAPAPVDVDVEVVTVITAEDKVEQILGPVEEKANAFLLAKNLIKPGQTFRDLSATLVRKIVANPEAILSKL